MIYGPGRGNVSYVDSLLFASGANTQAGLNPVNLNKLNTFQQFIIFLFPMLSNPITLHGCVVILRLYWFEKKFQGWVREARTKRGTLSKSKSRARDVSDRAEKGVNGRKISVISATGKGPRIANDGMLLYKAEDTLEGQPVQDGVDLARQETLQDGLHKQLNGHNEKVALDLEEAIDDSPEPKDSIQNQTGQNTDQSRALNIPPGTQYPRPLSGGHKRTGSHTAITFADTVKRSDGLDDEHVKLPPTRSNAEHIAILERQRHENDEVLRIPGPRDAERGSVPRMLHNGEADEDEELHIDNVITQESRPRSGPGIINGRQPTITIAEPEHRRRDDLATEAKTIGSTFESLRLRKPRYFNKRQHQTHEEDDDDDDEAGENSHIHRLRPVSTLRSVFSRDKTYEDMPYLSYNPTIGRNSNFIGLSLEQREELGGIEYRALRTLAFVLAFYFIGFQVFGLICYLPFIYKSPHYGEIVSDDGVSKTWWSFFTASSAFTDLGFTLTPDSMNSFHDSPFIMVIMSFLILIGNTGFPVMLRFVIWVLAQIVPTGTGLWEELRFLLDHPRRCFTLLFPSAANWWLFWILVLLNGIDLIFFVILDLGSGPVSKFPVHIRLADGLFQAASTRTAGFSCVSLGDLHPAVPVSYIIMMYISVFPIAISIRRTNVYEEKSLGVYNEKPEEEDDDAHVSAVSYVGTHLRRQLSFDLWYVFLGFFVLAISEGPKLQRGEFDLFQVLFEIVSAYGTVGMSFGWSGGNESLCSQFTTVGKLVIVAMEIRGRHRGLPYGLDRAVLLPSESRFDQEGKGGDTSTFGNDTVVTTGTTSGMQRRSASLNRGRSISRERRTNTNIVTQLLHPGPVLTHEARQRHKRAKSVDSEGLSLRPVTSGAETKDQEDDAMEHIAPLPSIVRPTSRRTHTTQTT